MGAGHQCKQWSRAQRGLQGRVLSALSLVHEQLDPVRLSWVSGQEFNWSLALAFAAFVATLVMVKHHQI
jgi:hypothetical protein